MNRRRTTSVDYRHPHRPLPVALLNGLGRTLGLRARLDPDRLRAAARRLTGLSDFGAEGPGLDEPLAVLAGAIEREARLTPTGRLMARTNLVRILSGRLRIERALTRHPEILAQRMAPPIFIVGLQRTGTTLLHRLLAVDPRLRYLASWEAVNPAPLPPRWLDRLPRSPDRRVRAARLAERALAYMAPDFFAIHPVEAEAPEEDCLLMDYSLWSTVFEATQRVPSFSRWLEARPDHTPAYRHYERVLKLLHFQRPGRWLLKTPHHLEQLDALLEVFPGARIIQTHRDPVRALASFCSMMAHGYGVFSDEVDPLEVGRHWSRKAHRMVSRAMATRDRRGEARVLDVAYADLLADPLAQVRRIYDWLGLSLGDRTERRMRRHLEGNPRHKHGRHRYRLEDFGLDRETEERAFSCYRERYSIPSEA